MQSKVGIILTLRISTGEVVFREYMVKLPQVIKPSKHDGKMIESKLMNFKISFNNLKNPKIKTS